MTFSLDAASRAAPRKEFRAERSMTPGRRAPRAAEPEGLDGLDATTEMLLVRIEDLHQKIDSMAENRGQIGSEAIGEDDTVRLEIARLVRSDIQRHDRQRTRTYAAARCSVVSSAASWSAARLRAMMWRTRRPTSTSGSPGCGRRAIRRADGTAGRSPRGRSTTR